MAVRHPRWWIDIAGARVPCLSASVSRSAKREGDNFAALLSITKASEFGFDLNYWTDYQPEDVSIVMATTIGGGDERVMITGRVDMPNVGLGHMRVSLTGRDKSASLTEKRRNEAFKNQKPVEIAGKIAKDHGLSLSFSGGGDFSGKIYDQDTVSLILNRTDFEVLSELAEQIGFRWFVDGSTLYMQPKDDADQGSYDVVWIPPRPGQIADANVLELSLRRDMTAARPHEFTVKSWHHRSRKLFKHTAKIDGSGDPLAYEDHHNGKTQKQVEDLAKARARDAVRHELGVTVRAPGDLTVDVRQVLSLSGTGTIYDQAYSIDHVTWDGEEGGAFFMVVDATAAKEGRDPEGTPGSGSKKASGSPPLPPPRPAGI